MPNQEGGYAPNFTPTAAVNVLKGTAGSVFSQVRRNTRQCMKCRNAVSGNHFCKADLRRRFRSIDGTAEQKKSPNLGEPPTTGLFRKWNKSTDR
jgi:hypothetical protein